MLTALARSVVDALDIGVSVHDPAGRIIVANALLHEILHVEPGALVGRDCGEMELYDLEGQRLSRDTHPVVRAMRSRQPVLNVMLAVERGSHPSSIRMSAIPRLDRAGTVTDIVVSVSDVTRALQAHRTLQLELAKRIEASEQLYRAVIEAMSEGVVVHAPDGRIVAANPAACEILGLSLEQLTGLSPLDPRWALVDVDGSPLPAEEIPSEVTRMTGMPRKDAQLGVSRPDGSQRWLSINTRPVGVGADRHVAVTITDITEGRRLAAQMRQRQRLEAIGDLSAGVAHNFNNLLAVIVPSLELAMADPDPVARNQTLGEALKAALAGAELVTQLLRVVRLDSSRHHDVADCTMVVTEVVEVCRRTFDRRIKITTELPEKQIRVRWRASELQQVVLNLCLNARDAIAGLEHPQVKISMHADASAVEIRVSDNGAGMSEEVQQRLGDPFFTTKGPQHGTGLGIATAVSALRDVQGSLTWQSRPGQGATFIIRLPVAPERAATPKASGASQTLQLPACEILVVDDDDAVRSVLARTIEALGPRVTKAESGERALRLVRANPGRFASALVDLSMPGMSGDLVLAQLRALAPALPVILVTGYLMTNVDLSAAAIVLRKPLDAQALKEALASVLMPAAR
ncbi:MAG: ATP-binding protein [Kofleriaceae bacterium]|nr:ATP-binding protein [Kofleriaceae bacterium]